MYDTCLNRLPEITYVKIAQDLNHLTYELLLPTGLLFMSQS